MKKTNKILFAVMFAIMLVFTSCDGLLDSLSGIDPQISSFSADDKSITAGEFVTFTIKGTNVDESVSSSTTDYGVTLSITDDDGDELWSDSVESSTVFYNGFDTTAYVTFEEKGTYDVTLTVTTSTGTEVESDPITITVEEAADVYYTVSFDTNDATQTIDVQKVLSGDKVDSEYVSKSGYVFGGWYTSSSFTSYTEWDFATDTVTKDITLYAEWLEEGSCFKAPEYVYFNTTNIENSSTTISIPAGGEYWVRTLRSANTVFAISGENATTTIKFTVYDDEENQLWNTAELPEWNEYSYDKYDTLDDVEGYLYIKFETYGFAGSFDLKLGGDPNQ